jgi:hypothetical protein
VSWRARKPSLVRPRRDSSAAAIASIAWPAIARTPALSTCTAPSRSPSCSCSRSRRRRSARGERQTLPMQTKRTVNGAGTCVIVPCQARSVSGPATPRARTTPSFAASPPNGVQPSLFP